MTDATYPVEIDGVKFEVRAGSPEEAAEKARNTDLATVPRVISRSGSTRIFERPNGQRYLVSPGYSTSDPAKIEEAMQGASAGEISTRSFDEQVLSQHPVAARGAEYLRGVVPGAGSYLDEAIGAVSGPEATAGMRSMSGAMQRERPGQTMALNLGGAATGIGLAALGAPLMPAPVQAALGTAGTAIVGQGPRIAQAARTGLAGLTAGGAEGAIFGYGEGTTPETRSQEAVKGGAFGAATGGVLGAAAPYVEAGVRNIAGLIKRSDIGTIASAFGISENAAKVIKATFEMGGGVPEAISRVERAGADGMIADAGEAAQALLDATSASGPAAAQAVREPLDQRMGQVAENLDTGLTGYLGAPTAGPETAVRDIMQRTAPERTAAYDQAYNTAIDYAAPAGRNVEDVVFGRIDPDVLNSAVREANAEMRDRGLSNQQILVDLAPDGTMSFREMPNVRQLDELKKALNGLARAAKKNEGTVSVDTAESLRYARQASDLRDAIVAATTDPATGRSTYAAATKIGGDTIQERNAYELGEAILSPRTRVEAVGIELGNNPSAAQIEALKSGLRTRIDQVVGDVKRIPSDPNIDARQALATLRELGSDNARAKISAFMGDEANDLFRLLDESMVAAETRAATSTNSRTGIRTATQQNVSDLTAPNVFETALSGEPLNTTARLIQAVTGYTDEFTAGQRQKVYMDLAKALTEKRGPDAVVALRALDAAMSGQSLTEAQTKALAKAVTNALVMGSTPALGRSAEQRFNQ